MLVPGIRRTGLARPTYFPRLWKPLHCRAPGARPMLVGMAMTDVQLLAATREAIEALTTGRAASYSIGGRSVTYQDLPDLWEQVRVLEARIRTAAGEGASVIRFGATG